MENDAYRGVRASMGLGTGSTRRMIMGRCDVIMCDRYARRKRGVTHNARDVCPVIGLGRVRVPRGLEVG